MMDLFVPCISIHFTGPSQLYSHNITFEVNIYIACCAVCVTQDAYAAGTEIQRRRLNLRDTGWLPKYQILGMRIFTIECKNSNTVEYS